jgi:hypothetical protein
MEEGCGRALAKPYAWRSPTAVKSKRAKWGDAHLALGTKRNRAWGRGIPRGLSLNVSDGHSFRRDPLN